MWVSPVDSFTQDFSETYSKTSRCHLRRSALNSPQDLWRSCFSRIQCLSPSDGSLLGLSSQENVQNETIVVGSWQPKRHKNLIFKQTTNEGQVVVGCFCSTAFHNERAARVKISFRSASNPQNLGSSSTKRSGNVSGFHRLDERQQSSKRVQRKARNRGFSSIVSRHLLQQPPTLG